MLSKVKAEDFDNKKKFEEECNKFNSYRMSVEKELAKMKHEMEAMTLEASQKLAESNNQREQLLKEKQTLSKELGDVSTQKLILQELGDQIDKSKSDLQKEKL